MPRDFRIALQEVLDAIAKVRRYTGNLNFEEFSADEKTIDAVVRNLEIIGEAVKTVPDDVRALHPEVEWRRIAGLRDILIHACFHVDLVIVWDIVQNKVDDLAEKVAAILAD